MGTGQDFSKSEEQLIQQEIAKRLKVVNGKLCIDKKVIPITLPGKPGKKGLQGTCPEHEWDGTKLRFRNPDMTWGKWIELRGKPGKPGNTPKKGIDYKDGKDGEDGYTPKKGKDYKDGEPGKTPVKGVDYRDGEDGKTPKKGVHYFDGEPGKTPAHQWQGTKLRFQNPDGTWGDFVDLKGQKGDPGKKPRLEKDYIVKDGKDGKDAVLPESQEIVILSDVDLVVGPTGKVALEKKFQPIKVIKL